MDVSKGVHVYIKRTDVFYTLMDKPSRTLVSARCKGANECLALSFELGPKLENWKKPKGLDIIQFKK